MGPCLRPVSPHNCDGGSRGKQRLNVLDQWIRYVSEWQAIGGHKDRQGVPLVLGVGSEFQSVSTLEAGDSVTGLIASVPNPVD
ncbi:hypothetical protein A5905_18445 [Prescottella equi]|nr:hypothetical protein A5905_18445 [Prescottella equi]